MYRTLSTSRKNRFTHPGAETRTDELANLLIKAFGYDQAIEQARQSRWDKVVQTIRFMESKSFSRY